MSFFETKLLEQLNRLREFLACIMIILMFNLIVDIIILFRG
jgi:hypothetical protein